MTFNEETYYLGIDVGAVSVKMGLITSAANRDVVQRILESQPGLFEPAYFENQVSGNTALILVTRYRRTWGEPIRAANDLLAAVLGALPAESKTAIMATGAGGKSLSQLLNLPYQNEFRAIARSVGFLHPEIKSVLELGGDCSKMMILRSDGAATGVLDYEVNGDCAAGTGSFLDQQASRLLYSIEDVGDVVIRAGKPATIAGRCSVFAKSDMIHAQQKGFQPPEILKGLCQAVVRNFKGTIIKGKTIVPPVALIGGVAANKGIVQALREILDLNEHELIVPRFYNWMPALGAALLLIEQQSCVQSAAHWLNLLQHRSAPPRRFDRLPPLNRERLIRLEVDHTATIPLHPAAKIPVFLGIDIGSVTTKLAVMDTAGRVLKGIYTKTQARPIEVVKNGLREIERELGQVIEIQGVGTTGSGRELIGKLVGADVINDEITAHKTGALHISHLHSEQMVDTIFDIGGQDSKFIALEDGIVVDFTMNEACAAGTGSFLEEQAERLGISIQDEFAKLAFASTQPIRLGERCTVFMEKEITPYMQQGADKRDIVAGLAYSIVANYLNRVVRGRRIGQVVYFQGGTAYNDAVAAAFSMVLQRDIIVPPFNGILGAIGAALLAQEKIQRTNECTRFRGFNLDQISYQLRSFGCKGCSNFCDIQEFLVEGNKTYWGDKCTDRYRQAKKVDREPIIPDLIAKRQALLFENLSANPNPSGRIGLGRSMYFYELFPFWQAYFADLGFEIVLSDETNRQIINQGVESRVAEPCFPITIALGHAVNLMEKGVDFLLVPNVVDAETQFPETNSFFCPWGQTLCFVVKATPRYESYRDKILAPTIRFRQGMDAVKKQMHPLAKQLGVSRHHSDRAIEKAYLSWRSFQQRLKHWGEEALQVLQANNEKAIILLGRTYNIYDKMVNLNVPMKLRQQYGINLIPLDFLPIEGIDIADLNDNMYWNYGRKILQAARWSSRYPNFHLIYITNFKCGPDSYIKHYVRQAAQKPLLTLQFDEHSNDAGIMTRCEAYLHSKGFLK
ncbi:MAG: acyl-CoA dehydratase activase [candidate division KSB1 bacterium]|nr:acyl-CoA dehydratase activase [candidate division KSB1 bacterium]